MDEAGLVSVCRNRLRGKGHKSNTIPYKHVKDFYCESDGALEQSAHTSSGIFSGYIQGLLECLPV